jgi:uncharacterized OsmC-like protein
MAAFSRSVTVDWAGSIMEGKGQATAGSGAFTLPVSFPSRIGEPAGQTSPEELIAAAHASCFAMALNATVGKKGGELLVMPAGKRDSEYRKTLAAIDWINRFTQAEATMRWMDINLDKRAVVATTNPPLVHLYTGQRTITLDTLTESWSVWRGRGARYIAPLVPQPLPRSWKGPYNLIYAPDPDAPAGEWVIDLK